MLNEAGNRYQYVQKCLETDPEYGMLTELLEAGEPEFRRVLAGLPEEDRQIILARISLAGEIDERILEIACFAP